MFDGEVMKIAVENLEFFSFLAFSKVFHRFVTDGIHLNLKVT